MIRSAASGSSLHRSWTRIRNTRAEDLLGVRLEPARALQVLRRPVQRIHCVMDQAAFGQGDLTPR